jgi:hypothetical protein
MGLPSVSLREPYGGARTGLCPRYGADPVLLRIRLATLALPALLLTGCGDDLSGKASAPDGYATYKGDGVRIAYPKGWEVTEVVKSPDGGSRIEITPREHAKTPYGLILLSSTRDAEKRRFERQVKDRRMVIETVTDGKIESDEKVDVPGTKDARRLTATTPPKDGTDPVKVKSDSLDLLRDNGDTLTVVVAAPQRRGDDELDPKAVIDSVRLSG